MSFVEEMKKNVPVVEISRALQKDSDIKKGLCIVNKYNEKYNWEAGHIPYVGQIMDYVKSFIAKNESANKNTDISDNVIPASSVVFIVTDSLNIAYKTAACAAYTLNLLGNDEDDDYSELEYYFEEDEDSRDSVNNECTLVDFNNIIVPESMQDMKYMFPLGKILSSEYVFFQGLENEKDVYAKTEGIQTVKCKVKFIHITKEQLSRPWVLNMCISNNSDVWLVDSMKDSYYVEFTDELMSTQGYAWEKGMSSEIFVRAVKKKTADELSEEKLAWFLDKAVSRKNAAEDKDKSGEIIRRADFNELELNSTSYSTQLRKMVGLADMKNAAAEYVALEKEAAVNDKLNCTHSNMIFYGNPGTGKTTGARLLAGILSENGVSSAKFKSVSRKDLIGKYIGHTAPLVSKCFEESRGGILFVDEAGFFLNSRAGDYTAEAMKEFIRYMELYPDVTVIFAMYEREVADFLELDDGLKSRISKLVYFKDYTMDELWCIAKDMFTEKGYELGASCKASFSEYMNARMKDKNFGNARDVRKLVESGITALSLKHAGARSKKEKSDRKITEEIMSTAINRLEAQEKKNSRLFGFNCSSTAKSVTG